jgi:hypothetical protein
VRAAALAPSLAAAVALAGCGGAGPTLPPAALGLPATAAPAAPLATTRVATSPDGGIYLNWDDLAVILLTTADPTPITARLGDRASEWAALRPLGRLTVLGIRLRNDGKAASEPGLDDLQVASDYAPDSTASGPLRHLYHPTFPLAALSDRAIAGNCSVHLDPGQAATVLLVYPPLRPSPSYLWGRYQRFALELRPGGAAGALGDLHVAACSPPQPPPS